MTYLLPRRGSRTHRHSARRAALTNNLAAHPTPAQTLIHTDGKVVSSPCLDKHTAV